MTQVDFVDRWDRRLVPSASGLLGELNRAGLLDPADIHVALRLAALSGEDDECVTLAAALAVHAVSQGSVCVDLSGCLRRHSGRLA